MTLDQSGILRLRSDVVATVMGEGAVLLDLRTKYFYSANKTAWAILSALESGAEMAAVARACGQSGQEGREIDAFLDFLRSEDLLESADRPEWEGRLALAGSWVAPVLEKHKEPLQRIMMSAFDPSVPLAE
jgi:hypothetical protein